MDHGVIILITAQFVCGYVSLRNQGAGVRPNFSNLGNGGGGRRCRSKSTNYSSEFSALHAIIKDGGRAGGAGRGRGSSASRRKTAKSNLQILLPRIGGSCDWASLVCDAAPISWYKLYTPNYTSL